MKEYMTKIIFMGKVDISGTMVLFIKENFNQELLKVLVLGNHPMEIHIKGNSSKV